MSQHSQQSGWSKPEMADVVIDLIPDGSSLNLGIGMPTLIIERMPANKRVMIHSENGVLGVDGRPETDTASPTLINAGKETIAVGNGASFFDSALSFGMIRGGHIDFCVLGGMEVDRHGSLANWMIPGKKVTGMGGAMDLVHGAKRVIVMLSHFSKSGKCKLVPECELPLTGQQVIHQVVTDLGLFTIENSKFKIEQLAPGIERERLGIAAEFLA